MTSGSAQASSSTIVPIRVDALSEDRAIRIVDTLLFDPTCWPVTLYQPLYDAVEENVAHIAHTILSDAEVQVSTTTTSIALPVVFTFCVLSFRKKKFSKFLEDSFSFIFSIPHKRVWEGLLGTLRVVWTCGVQNSKRPLKTSFGHNSGKLPRGRFLRPKTPATIAKWFRYPFGS